MDAELTTDEISKMLEKPDAEVYEEQLTKIITSECPPRILSLGIVSSIVRNMIWEINRFPLHAGLLIKITPEYDEVDGEDLGLRYVVITPPPYDKGHVGLTLFIDIVSDKCLKMVLDLDQSNGWNLVSYGTVIMVPLCDPTCTGRINDVIKFVRYFQALNIRDGFDRWLYLALRFMWNRGFRWQPSPSIGYFEQDMCEDQKVNNCAEI